MQKNVAAGAAAEKRTLLRSRHPCTPGIKHLHRLQDRIRQFRADSVMDLSLQAFQLGLRIAALLETLEQCSELELKKPQKRIKIKETF